MAENRNIEIGGRLHSIATSNVVTGANEVFDDDKNKKQSEINTETYSLVNDVNERLSGLSPEQQSALNVAAKATNNETKLGYYVCDTEGNVAAKVISNATGYVLSSGGSMKVKMTNANTVNNATLNINSTGAKALYYAGERASAINSWEEGETVEVYYDGTSFYANNVAGGSGSGDGVFDVSAKYPTSGVDGGNTYTLQGALAVLNTNLLASKKKGGMSIKFIQSIDNKYVQARCMAQNFTTDTTQWQGVDDEPTAGSDNLVKSGGVEKFCAPIVGGILKTSIPSIAKREYYPFITLGKGLYKMTVTPNSETDTDTLSANIYHQAGDLIGTITNQSNVIQFEITNEIETLSYYRGGSDTVNNNCKILIQNITIEKLTYGDDKPIIGSTNFVKSDGIIKYGASIFCGLLEWNIPSIAKREYYPFITLGKGLYKMTVTPNSETDTDTLSANIYHQAGDLIGTITNQSNVIQFEITNEIETLSYYRGKSDTVNNNCKILIQNIAADSNNNLIGKFYVDVVNGSDTNSGTTISIAFKTFAKAVEMMSMYDNSILYIAKGTYKEVLNISSLKGSVSIYGQTNEEVIISGSEVITGWEAVSDYQGIYKALFDGAIPVHGGHNLNRGVIYEVGRSSCMIDTSERHPSQKGLSYRLPFTPIQQCLSQTLDAALSDISENGGWYIDGGYIYIKNVDGSNPETNGYSYEYEKSGTFVSSNKIEHLFISNISFRYTTPVKFNALFTERYNCSVIGCRNDGFIDNAYRLRSYFDECAFCGNDGANGHFNSVTNWTNYPLRNSGEIVEYYYAWMHDNSDDGLSHHEASHIRVIGGLYEYNGDGGLRVSNTSNTEVFSAYFRKNGQDNSSASAKGSGIDCVNTVLTGDTRNGCNTVVYDCVSEDNKIGYGCLDTNNIITLINCISSNNSVAELYAYAGKVVTKNCKYIQPDISKVKVVENNGEILVNNYSDFA